MKLFQSLKEIPITTLPGLRIGNAQNYEAMTGVTVHNIALTPEGMLYIP